jgi:hypothetical protein
MSDSTSILDLPTDSFQNNQNNNNNNNNNNNDEQSSVPKEGLSLDQTTISQIVNGLQQATLTGVTKLPSRDIPMSTSGHNTDPQIQPNYVPEIPQNNIDYIKNFEQSSDIINNYNSNNKMTNSLDDMYNDIQIPFLLSILYFLFQLPFFKKFLYKYFPYIYSNDGNQNINGLLFTSVLFGSFFYSITKITSKFNTF